MIRFRRALLLATGALALAVPSALASPRSPPPLEGIVIQADLIVVAHLTTRPEKSGDLYEIEADEVLKGRLPEGPLRVAAAWPFSCMPPPRDAERPEARERELGQVLLFLHVQEDGTYLANILRELPADELRFGFNDPRPTEQALAAVRALRDLNAPGLDADSAASLWKRGLRSENPCLVACLIDRLGMFGPTRGSSSTPVAVRLHAEEMAFGVDLVDELRRLASHPDDEVRGKAILHLRETFERHAKDDVDARERVMATFHRSLLDTHAETRGWALGALAWMGDASVKPRILRLLTDADALDGERESALWAAGYLVGADSKQLDDALLDACAVLLDHPKIDDYAASVLRRMTGDKGRRGVAAWRTWRDARQR